MSGHEKQVARLGSLVHKLDELRATVPASSVALVLIRLRGLRRVNIRLGYSAGDAAINEFRARLEAVARAQDLVLQLSGNMFAMAIHAPIHDGHVVLAANKIARQINEWVVLGEHRVHLGVCMGATVCCGHELSSNELLARAESALQEGGVEGETVTMWQPERDGSARKESHPLFDARQAIENGEFRVYFQPKVDLRTGAPVGAEALARWRGPDGLVAPDSFLVELERSGEMAPLLQFVMNTASREMARWIRRLPGISVAVNSTANDLADSDLVATISEVLGLWNLAPEHLVLEITETAIMRNPDVGIATLEDLRALGIRTSIDDFGTGYSSLAYLKDLPVDEIKIDQSFVQNICTSRPEREIVAAIVGLGNAMGLQVIAEGVESQQVAHELTELGCHYGQGFYFGQPVTGQEFSRLWLGGARGGAADAI